MYHQAIVVAQYFTAQTAAVSDFVYEAYEKNVFLGTIIMLSMALVVIFIKWQKDVSKFLMESRSYRDANLKVIEDFNKKLEQKDQQVVDFALEMRDVINSLKASRRNQ